MSVKKSLSLATALLTLAGCSITSDSSVDTYYTNDFSMEPVQTEKVPQETSDYISNPPIVSEISKKVTAIEAKLHQIQKNIKKDSDAFHDLKNKNAEESGRYYEYIARIRARLQNGTTPGNPELNEMWKQASALLAGADKNLSDTAKLSSEMIRAKNELDSLLEAIRETFTVPGAMEIDHENLKSLEDQANQTIVSLNRLSSDLSIQITRQQQYFNTESQNLNGLSTDIQNGSFSNVSKIQNTPATNSLSSASVSPYLSSPVDLPEADLAGRRPLMIIRFDKQKVDYEEPLYKAVKAALDKRPATHFEIVAVSPFGTKSGAAEAAKNAKGVKDALLSMGLPASRIYSSQTTKDAIKTTEVHLYLR